MTLPDERQIPKDSKRVAVATLKALWVEYKGGK